ncbi:MAG: PEP-CTERM/exosortase A-associated glycosyltransferase, family [Bacteroidetes bacterium]|nr:PEP-CTERM/exosortase A-associated glycosyltransferase, family [Bacteroidota bacterium]
MKKVLIFTYYWPPAGGIAVQRFMKFAKYLPQYGWEPIIITVKSGSYPFADESLVKELAPDLRVYHTDTFEPFELYNLLRGKKGKTIPQVMVASKGKKSLFQRFSEYIRANYFIPDARKGWKPYALRQAAEIISTEKIDAIITAGPPHSTHLTGMELQRKFNIKWIADFRDPWTGIFYNQFLPRTKSSKDKDSMLEKEVLRHADCTVVISNGMKDMFAEQAKRLEVIYNCYDDEKFSKPESDGVPEKGFLFTYTGNLLATQDVPRLWEAFAEVKAQCPELKLLIIGNADDAVKRSISEAGIDDMVIYKSYMPHREVVNYMWYSQILLFLLANVADNKLLMTGKIFEYLPTGTELMGIGPVDGSAQDALAISHRPPIIDYEDKASMKTRILEAYEIWKENGKGRKFEDPAYQYFSATNITKQLAGLLDELTGN